MWSGIISGGVLHYFLNLERVCICSHLSKLLFLISYSDPGWLANLHWKKKDRIYSKGSQKTFLDKHKIGKHVYKDLNGRVRKACQVLFTQNKKGNWNKIAIVNNWDDLWMNSISFNNKQNNPTVVSQHYPTEDSDYINKTNNISAFY